MATVAPDVDRLRRLADRVQAAHAWLWDGGTQLSVLNGHRMECCDEDHQGCAHVGLVEMSRVVADSHADLLSALKAYVDWFGPAHVDGCPADDTCFCSGSAVNDAVNAAIAKAEGRS